MHPLEIILIGGGKIACGKNRFTSKEPMSHMEGMLLSSKVVCHAVVEPDSVKIAAIMNDWEGVCVYKDLADVPFGSSEVVVICSPTTEHYGCIIKAIERRPLVVIVEKPLCLDLRQANDILAMSQKYAVPVYVNYNRRLDKRFIELSTVVPDKPIAVQVEYSNGINNYSSHFIDLLLQWYGGCKTVSQIGKFNLNLSDPNPSFFLQFKKGFSAYFWGFDNVDYDLLDMKIWHKSGLLRLKAGGADISVERPLSGLFYEQYDHLDTVWQSTGTVSGFRELYELLGSTKNFYSLKRVCGLEMGILNVSIIHAVLKSHMQGGKAMCL